MPMAYRASTRSLTFRQPWSFEGRSENLKALLDIESLMPSRDSGDFLVLVFQVSWRNIGRARLSGRDCSVRADLVCPVLPLLSAAVACAFCRAPPLPASKPVCDSGALLYYLVPPAAKSRLTGNIGPGSQWEPRIYASVLPGPSFPSAPHIFPAGCCRCSLRTEYPISAFRHRHCFLRPGSDVSPA